uniref:Uncharacterized protein n=1 Tax=Arion vulgaris TaxID=1028688 RepID=A0A0B6Z6Q8_9EUPU
MILLKTNLEGNVGEQGDDGERKLGVVIRRWTSKGLAERSIAAKNRTCSRAITAGP